MATPESFSDKIGLLFRVGTNGLAVLAWLLVLYVTLTHGEAEARTGWPEAVLLLCVTFACLGASARQLPAQNVLLAATIIAIVGGGSHLLAGTWALPFGPIRFSEAMGPALFDRMGWAMPMIWIVAVLNSRGVARLILRPWRKTRTYGWWLIGITTALVLLFDFGLEPYAGRANRFWFWENTKLPWTWYGTPISNPAGWLLTTALILAFASPALMNKRQRQRRSTPDYHPLIVWLAGMALFGVTTAAHGLWLATGFCGASGAVVLVFAMRGARW